MGFESKISCLNQDLLLATKNSWTYDWLRARRLEQENKAHIVKQQWKSVAKQVFRLKSSIIFGCVNWHRVPFSPHLTNFKKHRFTHESSGNESPNARAPA